MKIKPLTISRLLSALASISLGGCALLTPQYPDPIGSEVAFLRVVERRTQSLPPRASLYTFSKAETCEGRMTLYNWTRPAARPEMVDGFARIESGKPFSLMVMTTLGTSYGAEPGLITKKVTFCAPIVTFVPLAGRYYVAEESFDDSQCFLRVVSAESRSMENPRTDTFKQKTFIRGFDESSSWCKPE